MIQPAQGSNLTLYLKISDSTLLEALMELLPQAGICVSEDPTRCDGLLSTTLFTDTSLPVLSLTSLAKPFRFSDLLSLLHNLPHTRVLRFAHFLLDMRERNLKNMNSSEKHRLTGKECQLLYFFYQNGNQEISKDKLLKEIWEYHPDTTTHTLETHIYRLRQKLEENPSAPTVLVNCKEGYLLKISS